LFSLDTYRSHSLSITTTPSSIYCPRNRLDPLRSLSWPTCVQEKAGTGIHYSVFVPELPSEGFYPIGQSLSFMGSTPSISIRFKSYPSHYLATLQAYFFLPSSLLYEASEPFYSTSRRLNAVETIDTTPTISRLEINPQPGFHRQSSSQLVVQLRRHQNR
jgi:hypothetical protein